MQDGQLKSNHQALWIPPKSPWWSLRETGNGASALCRRVKGQALVSIQDPAGSIGHLTAPAPPLAPPLLSLPPPPSPPPPPSIVSPNQTQGPAWSGSQLHWCHKDVERLQSHPPGEHENRLYLVLMAGYPYSSGLIFKCLITVAHTVLFTVCLNHNTVHSHISIATLRVPLRCIVLFCTGLSQFPSPTSPLLCSPAPALLL